MQLFHIDGQVGANWFLGRLPGALREVQSGQQLVGLDNHSHHHHRHQAVLLRWHVSHCGAETRGTATLESQHWEPETNSSVTQ